MNRNTKKTIPFSKPSIGRKERKAVDKVLRSGWLTSGKENQEFETAFSKKLDIPYSLTVQSATAGLHLALETLGVGPGDLVITTAYTFTASAEIIHYLGAKALLVDIDEDYNISPSKLEQTIEKCPGSIKAAILVHIAGYSCQMKEITSILKKNNIAIVEDCAHAFPVNTSEGYLGTLGDIGVFSFYANKTITTGEGGMIVCQEERHYKRMKLMRLHGIDRDVWNRYSKDAGHRSWQYDVLEAGYKYNLTNFQAAMGRIQLDRSESMKTKRENIALEYLDAFENQKEIILPPSMENHSWHLFIIRLKNETKRDELATYLFERGIGTSVHFIPLPCLQFYQKRYNIQPEDFPVSLDTYQRSLSLPIFPDMTKGQRKKVIKTILQWSASHG